MLSILVVAHNGAEETAQCLQALQAVVSENVSLRLLDNASSADQLPLIEQAVRSFGTGGRFLRLAKNEGFAGGMNRLLADALLDPSVDCVLLLNNDTLPQPGFLDRMVSMLDPPSRTDMVAARLMRADGSAEVDSLGITLYRSGLASNRKQLSERLLGPTGGCMLVTRRLLEDLRRQHGEWFDESFFCYAEDTDLVMRARWLGYECAHADEAVVLHHGSLSSGGPDNEFVLYHGIRNSIWALAKNAPALWLLVFSPWIVTAHLAIWLRQLRKGRARTLWRLYRDALCGLGPIRTKRRLIARSRRVPARHWWRWVEPRLYERDYLRRALRDLFRPGK